MVDIIYYIIYLGFEFVQFLMEFFQTSDCIDESQNYETCLQFKMNKYLIKTRKSIQKDSIYIETFSESLLIQTKAGL